jgi:urate oxidase
VIGWSRYGKASVRLVKVVRPAARADNTTPHRLIDLSLDIQLEGAFEPVFEGDNRLCIATDTMKNTVYALARQRSIEPVELFACDLADRFLEKPAVTRVRVSVSEQPWQRIAVAGRPHPHAFAQGGRERWTSVITRDRSGTAVTSGIADLVVLKTTDSAFAGFPRDEYTTLPETADRILATSVTAAWSYREGTTTFAAREAVRTALLETFAAHDSRSVQHTLAAMGEAALRACPDMTEVTLTLPNRHHLLVDLSPFGLDNPNEIFVATSEPYGLIEATVRREQSRG